MFRFSLMNAQALSETFLSLFFPLMNPDITVRYYNSELDWNSLNFRENQAKVLRNVKLVVILDNIFKRDSYLFFYLLWKYHPNKCLLYMQNKFKL